MMNFRESLLKVKQYKLGRYGEKTEVRDILEHVIEYFKLKAIPQFLSKTKLTFKVDEKALFAIERRNVFYTQSFEDSKEAFEVILNLKEGLRNEGYEIINESCEHFDVIIDPSC